MQKKILILTPGFPADENDTTTVPYIQDFVVAIQTFCELKIITFQYPFEEQNYVWNNTSIYTAGGKNEKHIYRLITWKKILKKMKEWHKQNAFDAILCFWLTETALIGEYFCRKNPEIKLFKWALGQDMKADNLYLRLLSWERGKTFVLSLRNTEKIAEKITFLPFGLPSYIQNISLTEERKIDIIGIGSHIPLKRYELFLNTIARLKKDFPQINCMLIGQGRDTLKLTALSEALHLTDNVRFISTLTRKEIFHYLAQSKILFHTSEFEGQGMVLTEALQMGCYVVCGDVGCIPPNSKTFIGENIADFELQLRTILLLTQQDFSAINIPSMENIAKKFLEYV